LHSLLFITGELDYTNGVTSHLYNLISELQINRQYGIMLLCTGGDSIPRFKDLKINVIEDIHFSHAHRSFVNFSIAIKRLVKLIFKYKIDIVHSHNHYAANISYYASRLTSAGTVQTNHGLIPDGGFLKHFKAHKIITVSRQIEKYILSNNLASSGNVKYINQGYRFAGTIRKDINKNIKIICASRLIYEKGVDVFIRAAKIVGGGFNDKVQFLVAGDGEYKDELMKLAKKTGVRIEFTGTVKDLPELFSETNIFVMPSRSKSEGFPMTIVEAALTKNLIITSGFNTFEDIFKDGIDGYTFEVDNYEQLAKKLINALTNTEKAEQMTNHFYRKSKIIFDPEVMVDKHAEVYEKCLKR